MISNKLKEHNNIMDKNNQTRDAETLKGKNKFLGQIGSKYR